MFDPSSLSLDVLYYIGAAVLTVVRASGVTVKSGNTGLIYTLGRVDREVPRWFRPLLPIVRRVPFLVGRMLEHEVGLTALRAQTLLEVADGATRLRDVAARTTQLQSAASRTVDGLVEDGLLERGADPDDRRSLRLTLTVEGRRAVERIEAVQLAFSRRVLDTMASEDARRVAEVLDAYLDGALDVLAADGGQVTAPGPGPTRAAP